MEERIIVLALCSFSRGALFSEVVMCSFSWILFLTARLGGSFKSYAHFKVSISTRKGLLSKRLRSLQGIRSLCSMKKRCVKFTHRFASRVAKMEIRNVLRLSLRYLSPETDVGADNADKRLLLLVLLVHLFLKHTSFTNLSNRLSNIMKNEFAACKRA